MLILDDFGMGKLSLTAAEELLELIMRRYERASKLVTSNRPGKTGARCRVTPLRSVRCLTPCFTTGTC